MEYNAPCTLTVPGPVVITFNAATGDTYQLDPSKCSGLDQAPIRAPVDNKPGADGGIVFDFLKGPRRVTLGGEFLNRTGTASARNTLELALIAALDLILAADGTLAITQSGQSAKSLTVRCEVPHSGSGGFQKQFLFGLVAANPVFA